MPALTSEFKSGYVAIVGEPNVGKSTLLNALLGEKLSIVTAKPQTTRQRVLGIFNDERAQIVFLDTPGLIKPKYLLHAKMLEFADWALEDADLILIMTEVGKQGTLPSEVEERVLKRHADKILFAVINKVDAVYKPHVLPVMDKLIRRNQFREVIPISALKRQNLDDLLNTIIRYLPNGNPLYPTDILSEHPERFFVSEFIREKIFERFSQEVPYSTAVEIREFKERETGGAYILADIVVERPTQKAILIGKHGQSLKEVGSAAREEIERFLQRKVFLELFVKVRENWRDKEQSLRNLGYHMGKQ
ncbi:MAG: GTPase Era [Ignavibacteriales bacterium]|nr:GTPase Era [Ignavibacteriales bacterium]